jgi:hypothetical protein
VSYPQRHSNRFQSSFSKYFIWCITGFFGGDFRQTLPVIQNPSRQQILQACIVNSYLWKKCRLLQLTENMRLDLRGLSDSDREELRVFAEWLLRVSSRVEHSIQIGTNCTNKYIKIPQSLLLPQHIRNLDGLIFLFVVWVVNQKILHLIFPIALFCVQQMR